MTPNDLSQLIINAASTLRVTTSGVSGARQALTSAQRILQNTTDAILLQNADDPKALGSNEAARSATLKALTVQEREAVDHAQRVLAVCEADLALARITWDEARYLVRANSAPALAAA